MNSQILVVDDESDLELLIRQKFRRQIRNNQYEFHFALNGVEALKVLEKLPDVDVVLSDINMPEMDGLTLLSKLKEKSSLMKTVVVSAYGDLKNIRTAMNRGAFDFVTKPINFEDLEKTIEKAIAYAKQLRETMNAIKENNILKMYVNETVLNFMGTKNFEQDLSSNETIEASVVFIDICGFTAISEKETPDKVVNMLNQYFDLIVKEIIAQDGVIDKFIGDCVMGVFKGNHHLDRALETSIIVRDKIMALPKEGNFSPKVSIGVNFGEMISGNIGSTTLRRLDYTVIGDTVNVAYRLQNAAGECQIVITENAYKKIGKSFNCKLIGPVTLKNRSQAITLYEVID